MAVKPEDIATLVEMFEQSGWDELHVEIDGLQLFLSTDPHARLVGAGAVVAAPAAFAPAPMPVAPAPAPVPVAAPTTAGKPSAPGDVPAHYIAVTAPNLGTFYRAPKPGEPPFVQVGQVVRPDTEMCLLEVMKLFTTVIAGVAGTVRQICVADADMVEFGQPLFYIEPA